MNTKQAVVSARAQTQLLSETTLPLSQTGLLGFPFWECAACGARQSTGTEGPKGPTQIKKTKR